MKLIVADYSIRTETGYVFIVFDEAGSNELHSLSIKASKLMRVGDAEPHMPYGFDPHTSLLKVDSEELQSIYNVLPRDFLGQVFKSKSMVISKEIMDGKQIDFKELLVVEHQIPSH